jgi:metallo-beta-lactamase family protein
MHAEFHGAARTVTGSCTLLEAGGTRVLVDCGQFQGDDELEKRNRERFVFEPRSIHALVLTHAHIDHIGRVPVLLSRGFEGPIFATRATAELAAVMLLDGAKIAKEDERHGGPPALYDDHDVEKVYQRIQPVKYGKTVPVRDGFEVTLTDAGHILGSAHVLATMREDGRTVRYGVSGDVGAHDRPVVSDPTPLPEVDHLQVESTYGERDHGAQQETVERLAQLLEEVHREGGLLIVPAFALGRTQEILWHIGGWKREGRFVDLPVYVDSPLATRVTGIFRRNPECFDEDTRHILRDGDDPFEFQNLHYVSDAEESERLSRTLKGAVMIASSGMCQSGRVVGHLLHRLPDPTTRVVIVGYQAHGTLGARLQSGATKVTIRGQEVDVAARIETLSGFSAHAGRSELLRWIRGSGRTNAVVHLVHGEPQTLDAFAKSVEGELGLRTHVPEYGEKIEL